MGTRNTLAHLNNHLFEQLERLNDDELQGEELEQEVTRARAMTGIATQIINNARVVLDATKLNNDNWNEDNHVPRMLTGDGDA